MVAQIPAAINTMPGTQTNDANRLATQGEKRPVGNGPPPEAAPDDGSSQPAKQGGVERVEAITTVWTRQTLLVMFVLLYLVCLADMMLQNVQGNLVPYVTSAFQRHGLLATTNIVALVLGGVFNLVVAKVMDVWGRCEGFVAMLVCLVVGIVLKATCSSVHMYAAGHTIYWVGRFGLEYVVTIILADMTTLRNRLILFGLQQTPLVVSTLAGPQIASLFYSRLNFRWAFGAFCIILVAFCLPVAVVFFLSKRKALALGLYTPRPGSRGRWQSIGYYFVQFDVIGMLLTVVGWSLLLLPLSFASSAPHGWRSGYIVAMIVLGSVLLAAFVVWERFFAPVSYFPWEHLKNRTVLGANLVYGLGLVSVFCWDTYYGSYLQVVHFQDMAAAGYVLNTFSLTAAVVSPFVGLLVRYTGSFKWLAIASIPVAVLGTALLFKFRTSDTHIGLLVMCQLLNGISSSTWSMTAQLAIMASIDHQQVAVAIAMFGVFGSIGASIGQAIAGGIWTSTLPGKLEELLPPEAKDQAAAIYGDITIQMAFPKDSPERNAIIGAYDYVQRRMLIAGSALLPFCLGLLLIWKNVNVKSLEAERGRQTKGTVF